MSEENTDRKFYSEREKLRLLNLIEQYKTVVENKRTDGESIRKKQEVWDKIVKLYNSHDVTKRNVKQLKKLWDNIKQKTRKHDSERKNYILKTGGVPPPEEDNNPIGERVRSILTIDYEVENDFDSIAIFKDEDFQEVKKIDEKKVVEKPDLQDDTNSINRDFKKEESTSCFEIPELEDHTYEINRVATVKLVLDKETALRRKKLEDSIEQQKELYLAKMEVVALEKKYWQKKIELEINKF